MDDVRRRRTPRRRRGQKALIFAYLLTIVAMAAGTALHVYFPSRTSINGVNISWAKGLLDPEVAAVLASSTAVVPEPAADRVVYPYSVIPGGVRNSEDLKQSVQRDGVVRDHYAGFDFTKAHVIEVQEPRLVYLSYRIGDKIFWTAKKISLHKGETLVSDGHMTARGRCGNQVSVLPQKNISKQEPVSERV